VGGRIALPSAAPPWLGVMAKRPQLSSSSLWPLRVLRRLQHDGAPVVGVLGEESSGPADETVYHNILGNRKMVPRSFPVAPWEPGVGEYSAVNQTVKITIRKEVISWTWLLWVWRWLTCLSSSPVP